jgi:CDGSH-type Zn-finger protein
MPGVTIRALKNGPYEVRGAVVIEDYEGATFPADGDPVYLCRCGQSANRPFCDSTHKKVAFQAPECVRLKSSR